ncbi:hypothetical protein RN001_016105 [Aquatica leii]|uniref:DUF4773 domain-containing protein n=1 Tax=Aquatica leii TaxID=1421715 RepID=A0AAN7S5Z5_9COLE|nr:hypothetical protein RN001_016105 [Aquatica leii]
MQFYIIFVATILFANNVFARENTASIFDLLTWDLEDGIEAEKRDESSSNITQRSCVCNGGPSCMCCVDFNMTYFDFGEPGCVYMKYISQEKGMTVNISYGESILHSQVVKGPNPEPTCISVLVNLVQMCARFSNVIPVQDGLKGCLQLEPKLLGEVPTTFNIGCFIIGPDGMKQDPTVEFLPAKVSVKDNANKNETGTESEELNEEELIAVVNETAEQGLAFFGNWLGLFGKSDVNGTNTENVDETNLNVGNNSNAARSFSPAQNKV